MTCSRLTAAYLGASGTPAGNRRRCQMYVVENVKQTFQHACGSWRPTWERQGCAREKGGGAKLCQ
eukprot:182601-Pelagomonas_calceolata.AAC.3